MNKNGYLITLEGGEGSGKTVVGQDLRDHLISLGLPVEYYREPGTTRIGEQIRKVVLSPDNHEISSKTEALLFQAARAQFCEQLLWPALKEGKVVISDRFTDSSKAYQGWARGLGKERIAELNRWSTDDLIPDLSLFFDVKVETGLQRRDNSSEGDRLDKMEIEFHRKVREGYLDAIREDKTGRWGVIDANQELQVVRREAILVAEERLSVAGFIERSKGKLERR